MNIELAAAAYLSSKTEAVAIHNQFSFVDTVYDDNQRACGTSACIAGHVIAFEHGGFDQLKKLSLTRRDRIIVYEAYLNLTGRRIDDNVYDTNLLCYFQLKDGSVVQAAVEAGLFKDKGDAIAYRKICRKVFYQTFSEEKALAQFKKWVEEYSTEEEWAEFQALTNMDPNALLKELEYA